MGRRRTKIITASIILAAAMVYLGYSGIRETEMDTFTPDKLIANADEVNQKGIKVNGFVLEESHKWDAAKFELTFAVRDREGKAKVNVIYDRLKPDNFKDGGPVSVEGKYHAERNLITASKLTTKCASKYEAAESAATTTEY